MKTPKIGLVIFLVLSAVFAGCSADYHAKKVQKGLEGDGVTVGTVQQEIKVGMSTFYVSPQGKDINPGTVKEPFATLERARDTARKSGREAPKKIILKNGEYYLNRTLELDSRDSHLTIEVAPAAKAILYGGQKIENWEKESDKFYSASLPEVKIGDWDFRALAINGRLCQRARLPESGKFTHRSKFDVPWITTSAGTGWGRKPTEEELTTLKYDPNDIPVDININNAEMTVYHCWDESLVGIKSIDTKNEMFTFSNPSGHPAGAFGIDKYVIWNTKEGMTKPGQWYLDRSNGKIIYWPLPEEDMNNIKAIAPKIETIINIKGSEAEPAKDIIIKGVAFSVTNTPLKAGGFGAIHFDGAVKLTYTQKCQLVDLEIFNVGGYGISGSCLEGVIQNCHIYNTGAGGIRFGGSTDIINNLIHNVGVIFTSSIAIGYFGANATDLAAGTFESIPKEVEPNEFTLIAHNEIHDTPYTAIAVVKNRDFIIKGNRIYRVMQVLRDGAGIYITHCENIKVLSNFVSDILSDPRQCHAYYIDEQAKECLIEGNLSLRCDSVFLSHMNHGNVIRNNIFITEGDACFRFSRSTCNFEKNILFAGGTINIHTTDMSSFRGNILHGVKGEGAVSIQSKDGYQVVKTQPLKAENGNVLDDPKILEFKEGQIHFAPDSPAQKMGIKSIDISWAGEGVK